MNGNLQYFNEQFEKLRLSIDARKSESDQSSVPDLNSPRSSESSVSTPLQPTDSVFVFPDVEQCVSKTERAILRPIATDYRCSSSVQASLPCNHDIHATFEQKKYNGSRQGLTDQENKDYCNGHYRHLNGRKAAGKSVSFNERANHRCDVEHSQNVASSDLESIQVDYLKNISQQCYESQSLDNTGDNGNKNTVIQGIHVRCLPSNLSSIGNYTSDTEISHMSNNVMMMQSSLPEDIKSESQHVLEKQTSESFVKACSSPRQQSVVAISDMPKGTLQPSRPQTDCFGSYYPPVSPNFNSSPSPFGHHLKYFQKGRNNDLFLVKTAATRLGLNTRRESYTTWRNDHLDAKGRPLVKSLDNTHNGHVRNDSGHHSIAKINSALSWIIQELKLMREQDNNLANQFLKIRRNIHELKLQWCCEEYKAVLEDAEIDMATLENLKRVSDIPEFHSKSAMKDFGLVHVKYNHRKYSLL